MSDHKFPCIRCGGTGQEPKRRGTVAPLVPRPVDKRKVNLGHTPERRIKDRRGSK